MYTYGMNYTPQMFQQQQQRLNMLEQQYPQYQQPYTQPPQTNNFVQQQPVGLQGKSVDSIDVVKAMDIPLDGSISYFPLTDGTAIVTKQLQMDGTSKTIIYKPVNPEETKQQQPKYVTIEEVQQLVKQEPKEFKDIKEDIKLLKKQIRDISDDFKEFKRRDDE